MFPARFAEIRIDKSLDGQQIAIWVGNRLVWRGTLSEWLWAISHPNDEPEVTGA